jgi:hypothetical protein
MVVVKDSTENVLFCFGLTAKKIKHLQSFLFLVSLIWSIRSNPIILLFTLSRVLRIRTSATDLLIIPLREVKEKPSFWMLGQYFPMGRVWTLFLAIEVKYILRRKAVGTLIFLSELPFSIPLCWKVAHALIYFKVSNIFRDHVPPTDLVHCGSATEVPASDDSSACNVCSYTFIQPFITFLMTLSLA